MPRHRKLHVKIAAQATGRLLQLCARATGVAERDLLHNLVVAGLDRAYNRLRFQTGNELPPLEAVKLMDETAFHNLLAQPVHRHYVFRKGGKLYLQTNRRKRPLEYQIAIAPPVLKERLNAFNGSSDEIANPGATRDAPS